MKAKRTIGTTPRKRRFLLNLHRMRKAKGVRWLEIAESEGINHDWLRRVASRGLEAMSPEWGNVEAVKALAKCFNVDPYEFWADPLPYELQDVAERLIGIAASSGVTIDGVVQRLTSLLSLLPDQQQPQLTRFFNIAREHPRKPEIREAIKDAAVRDMVDAWIDEGHYAPWIVDMLLAQIDEQKRHHFLILTKSHRRQREIEIALRKPDFKSRVTANLQSGMTPDQAMVVLLAEIDADAAKEAARLANLAANRKMIEDALRARPEAQSSLVAPDDSKVERPKTDRQELDDLIRKHARATEIQAAFSENPGLWDNMISKAAGIAPPKIIQLILGKLDQDQHEREREDAAALLPIGNRRKK